MRRKKVGKGRRRTYGRRRYVRSSARALHAPKRFTSTYSQAVVSYGSGAHADSFDRNRLATSLRDCPIFPNLFTLYGQFAITGVKVTYVPDYNSSTGSAGNSIPNIAFAEDKNSDTALTYTALEHQDNVKLYSSARRWSRYIKNPRPLLYQQDTAGTKLKTITPGRQIHWLSPASIAATDPAASLVHLFGQMCVEDIKGIAAAETLTVGTLYYKVYLVCKEQRVATNVSIQEVVETQ